MSKLKLLLVVAIAGLLAAYLIFDLGQYLSLSYVQSQLDAIQGFTADNFAVAAATYFAAYVLITSLSIPGAAIVTLVGGAVFGLLWGTVLVSFASTLGATLAFLS